MLQNARAKVKKPHLGYTNNFLEVVIGKAHILFKAEFSEKRRIEKKNTPKPV